MTTVNGVPSSGQEILYVGENATGITAGLAGDNNERTVVVQAVTNGVYYTLHSATATPTRCDLYLSCGSMIAVTPASKFRAISESTSGSAIKVQAFE